MQLLPSVSWHNTDFIYMIVSLEEMGTIVLRWREAFPDLRLEIEELIFENDIGEALIMLSGTHEELWRGAEPSGHKVTMALMMFFRFEDGKPVELREVDHQLGSRKRLGIIPAK
jgi:predicted ester cyclase